MARKTRRHTKKHKEDTMTIPEVRRAFEHMEDFIHDCHTSGEDHATLVKSVRKEWARVFHKELSKASAEKLLENHMSTHRKHPRGTRKRGGSASPLGFAPVDAQMRSGSYSYSTQGGMGDYFLNGLRTGIPEIGKTQDVWPSVPQDMGTNPAPTMKGGNRRGVRRSGGASIGTLLSAAWERPAAGSSPSSFLSDMRTMLNGQQAGSSPVQYQQSPPYQAGSNVKPISF
jgi:hypothetical protein